MIRFLCTARKLIFVYAVLLILRGSHLAAAEGLPLDTLISQLKSKDEGIRFEAASTVARGEIKEAGPLVPFLAAALDDPSPRVRSRAAAALGLTKSKQAVEPLIRALHSNEKKVRSSALLSVWYLGPLAVDAVGPLIVCLREADPDIRYGAARAIGSIGPPAAPAIPDLIQLWRRRSLGSIERNWYLEAIGFLGPDPPETIPALLSGLREQDSKLRYTAVQFLSRFGPKAAVAVEPLIRTLEDEDNDVRCSAVWALWTIGASAAPALPALRKSRPCPLTEGAEGVALAIAQIQVALTPTRPRP
jgi:HEAT repeat protein